MSCSTSQSFDLPEIMDLPVFHYREMILLPGALECVRVGHKEESVRELSLNQMVCVPANLGGHLEASAQGPRPSPSICTVAIIEHVDMRDNGDRLILFRGIGRAQLVTSLGPLPERHIQTSAQVSPVQDVFPMTAGIDRLTRREELLHLASLFLKRAIEHDLLLSLAVRIESLSELCDTLAAALPITDSSKASILCECDVDLRSELLLDALRRAERGQRNRTLSWPPQFGRN